MKVFRDTSEQVAHIVELFTRGVLGPSAMWLGIADVLTPESASNVLQSLGPEARKLLHDAYVGRPPHVYIARFPLVPDEARFQAVCVQIVRWHEANFPREVLPSEPDGLIRVRVVDDFVQEWRPGDAPDQDASK